MSRGLKRYLGALRRVGGEIGCCCTPEPPPVCDPVPCLLGDDLMVSFQYEETVVCDPDGPVGGAGITGPTGDVSLPPSGDHWENSSPGWATTGAALNESLYLVATCNLSAYPDCVPSVSLYILGVTTGDTYFYAVFGPGAVTEEGYGVSNMAICPSLGVRGGGGTITIRHSPE